METIRAYAFAIDGGETAFVPVNESDGRDIVILPEELALFYEDEVASPPQELLTRVQRACSGFAVLPEEVYFSEIRYADYVNAEGV